MTTGIFLMAIVCLSLQNVGYKLVSRAMKTQSDGVLFSSIIVSIVAVLSCLYTTQSFVWNTMTILLGGLFGVFFALCEVSYMMALATGSMSFSSLFLSCAMVIPTIAGVIFWGEKIRFIQIVGIILLMVSIVFGSGENMDGKRFNTKWLIFGILTFLSNGMISVMQKAQQIVVGEGKNGEFMVVSFVTAAVLLWIIYLLMKQKQREDPSRKKSTVINVLPFTIFTAAASAIGNQLVLYSAGEIDASVMFPVMNGGILIICSLAAAVFFKERLSKKQWIGVGVGILSVLLIST